jgi:hypothetical protein
MEEEMKKIEGKVNSFSEVLKDYSRSHLVE